jgi:hypothetical protein
MPKTPRARLRILSFVTLLATVVLPTLWGCQAQLLDDDDQADVTDGEGSAEASLVGAERQVLAPVADTFIRSGSSASTSYGSASTLIVDASDSGRVAQSFLRFDVGEVASPIARARLRVYCVNGSSSSLELHLAANDWDERSTRYEDPPTIDPAAIGLVGQTESGSWIEIDVTAAVQPAKPISFALLPRSGDGFRFRSREASSRRPQLVLDLAPAPDAGGAVADGSAAPDLAGPTPDLAPAANLVFTGDFEAAGDFAYGGTYSQFSSNVDTCEHDKTCATDSMAIVGSPVRRGARAVRITLRSTDTQSTSGTRAEIQTGSHYTTTLEEDYWYGFSIFVPSDWVFDASDMKVVHQFHTGGGNPGASPIVGLRIRGSSWLLTTEKDSDTAVTLWSAPVERGVWTDFVLHVRWSPTTTGRLETFHQGKLVYAETGRNMDPGTTSGGHYQKLGLYGSFGGAVKERTLYYDEVRVAKGAGGYAAVAP